MCLLVKLGGLGIKSATLFNQALLGKWLWHYGHEVTHLWWRVISTKNGKGQGGGARKCAEGLMDVAFGEAFMKGGRVFLSISLL